MICVQCVQYVQYACNVSSEGYFRVRDESPVFEDGVVVAGRCSDYDDEYDEEYDDDGNGGDGNDCRQEQQRRQGEEEGEDPETERAKRGSGRGSVGGGGGSSSVPTAAAAAAAPVAARRLSLCNDVASSNNNNDNHNSNNIYNSNDNHDDDDYSDGQGSVEEGVVIVGGRDIGVNVEASVEEEEEEEEEGNSTLHTTATRTHLRYASAPFLLSPSSLSSFSLPLHSHTSPLHPARAHTITHTRTTDHKHDLKPSALLEDDDGMNRFERVLVAAKRRARERKVMVETMREWRSVVVTAHAAAVAAAADDGDSNGNGVAVAGEASRDDHDDGEEEEKSAVSHNGSSTAASATASDAPSDEVKSLLEALRKKDAELARMQRDMEERRREEKRREEMEEEKRKKIFKAQAAAAAAAAMVVSSSPRSRAGSFDSYCSTTNVLNSHKGGGVYGNLAPHHHQHNHHYNQQHPSNIGSNVIAAFSVTAMALLSPRTTGPAGPGGAREYLTLYVCLSICLSVLVSNQCVCACVYVPNNRRVLRGAAEGSQRQREQCRSKPSAPTPRESKLGSNEQA